MPRLAVIQLTGACILLVALTCRVEAQNTTCQGQYLMADGTTDPSTHLDNWTVSQSTVYLPNTNLGDNDPLNLTRFSGTAGIQTPNGQNYSTTASANECATQCAASVGPQLLLGVDIATVQNITTNKWFVACNMFIWCGSTTGCCGLRTGCGATNSAGNIQPYQSCFLKFQLNLTSASTNSTPGVFYTPTDVQSWLPGSEGGAFTSGLYLRAQNSNLAAAAPPSLPGYTVLPAQDYSAHDFNCPGSLKPGFCNLLGSPQSLSQSCNRTAQCTGFVYRPANADPDPAKVYQASGWLKTDRPLNTSCTSVSTFLTTYKRVQLPDLEASGTNTAAIAGGVVGGVVGLALISAAVAAFLIVRRRRSGHRGTEGRERLPTHSLGPLNDANGRSTSKHPILDSYQRSDDASSAPQSGENSAPNFKRKVQWSMRGSGEATEGGTLKSLGLSGPSTDLEGQPDAGTLTLARMKSKGPSHQQLWGIRPDEIRIMKNEDGSDCILGSGAFGSVYKAQMNGVDTVAVKVLKGKQDERTARAFVKEMAILRSCLHPQILQYMGSCTVDGHTLLITEYLDGGDLWSAFGRDYRYCWQNKGRLVALDIAKALAYLHSREPKVVHQDVKSSNCLLTKEGRAKLADVGLARMLAPTMSTTYRNNASAVGTWAWAAPEKLMGEMADERADIYSYGVLLHEICSQEMPDRGRLRPIRVPQEAPQTVVDLMWSCMNKQPEDRPSARQCVEVISAAQ